MGKDAESRLRSLRDMGQSDPDDWESAFEEALELITSDDAAPPTNLPEPTDPEADPLYSHGYYTAMATGIYVMVRGYWPQAMIARLYRWLGVPFTPLVEAQLANGLKGVQFRRG